MECDGRMKKWIMGVGLACLCILAGGCGASTAQKAMPVVMATPEPTPTPVPVETPAAPQGELVEMQAVSPENQIRNVAGDKNTSNASVIVENKMGEGVDLFFLRLHPEDDDEEEWGDERIRGAFKLPNNDRMILYYEGQGRDRAQSTLYDLRVILDNEDMDEYYFRNIPLETISRITLRIDGAGEDSLPFATYSTTNSPNKEFSTLNEVKKRLGLLSEDEDEEEEYEEEDRETYEEDPEYEENEEQEEDPESLAPSPTPTTAPETPIDTGEIEGDSFEITDTMSTAMSYIGSSLSDLQATIGSPNGSDYVEEPGMGNTGYHYYGPFTVSTSVDDAGNEIVTGVW